VGTLTELKIRALIRANEPCALADGGGLTFTLSKAGTAAWVLRYRHGGKARELSMGRYPALSLAEARMRAAKLKLRVADGEDVAASKRASAIKTRTQLTLKGLAADYLRVAAGQLRPGSLRQRTRLLEKEVLPTLGHLPCDAVTSEDVASAIRRTAARSPATAEITLVALRMLYSHARAAGIKTGNPTAGLKYSAIAGKRERARERRILSQDELGLFLRQLAGLGSENELALRILLLTGTRKAELQLAEWHEIDLDAALWTIPAERSKSHRGFQVPLPGAAVDCFRQLKALAGEHALVLPQHTGRSRGKATSAGRLNYALTQLKGLDGITPHDLRATLRSYLGTLGVEVAVAERCLNHSLGGLIEVYDRNDYLVERRRALERWATMLEAAERGDGKVVRPRAKTA
jgi:integrase